MGHKGVFISCEGGEGVGKSSFLQKLLEALNHKGLSCIKTREPGGSPLAEKLRPIFNHPPEEDPLTPEAEFFLLSAARIQHVKNLIKPNLQAGTWVLCDRFSDSSLVYQGILGGLSREFLNMVIHHSTFNLMPHTSFLLDCPVDISLARLQKRNVDKSQETRYDKAERVHHIKIREAYLTLAKEFSSRYVVLDASQKTEDLVHNALRSLEERKVFLNHPNK